MTGCALAAFAVCAEARAAEAAERPAAVETAAPRIVKAMPPDGRRDVKIHFYVDGHRRNKDANMRKDTSRAYLRALNALRLVLPDRNNPIDDGLRQRGIGKNVEVNTGTAYLLKPEGIVPVSLAKEAEAKDFGAFGKEVGAWDRDVLVRQILENEKAAENVVVCVISNDPSLSTRHGVFHLDEARGIMFFMLHAQRESVNGGIFHPYWSDEEWASFLREAMGANANDIANAIVDGYYALSADEENGLRALACAPADETISVKKIRSLPQKKLWKTTLTHNGVDVPNAEDAATLAPKSGQNKIVAQVLSPTGVSYSRTWEQDEFVYWTLGNDTRLHDQARDAAAKAKTEGMTGGKVADLNDFLQNPDKPVTKECLATFRALVAEVVAEADRLRQAREDQLRELRAEVGTLKNDVSKLDLTPLVGASQKGTLDSRIEKLSADVAALGKSLTDGMGVNEIRGGMEKVRGLKSQLGAVRQAIMLEKQKWQTFKKAQADLLEKIGRRKRQLENGEKTCTNLSDLDGFFEDAKSATTGDEVARIGARVTDWKPTIQIVDVEQLRMDLAHVVQKKLDDPENSEEKITNRFELEAFLDQVKAAKTVDELNEIKLKVEAWEPVAKPVEPPPPPPRPLLPWIVLLSVLVAGGVYACRFFEGRPVSTISYLKTGSTDAAVVAEAKLNKPLRFDEALACAVDIRVTPKRNEADDIEYEVTSPNKNVWFLKLGGSTKKRIGDVSTVLEDGDYQMFDNEIAMQPIGMVKFTRIETV